MLPNRLQTAANTAAIYAAALCLLVAPFRGATGLRAALLVLAMLFIAVAAAVRREWRWLLPPPRMVRNSVAVWALALLAGSLMTSNHWRALDSWKGDVLTPLLALLVFYALTNTEADMKRWLKILFFGLIGLTSFAIWNVFVPVDTVTMPAFGGMGPYSTWLVTLCALLPLAWAWVPPGSRIARVLTICAMVLILLSALLTTVRAIWICFGIMLLVFAAISYYISRREQRNDQRKMRQLAALVLVGGALFSALFFAATEWRFNGNPPGGGGAIEMLTHDNRGIIWHEAMALITEAPITGYGYGREVLAETMTARFSTPLDKALFKQAHNIVLNQVLQIGVIGGVLILAVFASLLSCFTSMIRRDDRSETLTRTVGLCGVLLVVGIFARNMVDDFFIRQNAILFWAIVGMLLGLGMKRGGGELRCAREAVRN